MPERLHLPSFRVTVDPPADDEPYRTMDARFNVYTFLKSLEHVWKHEVARPHEHDGDWRHGGNVSGWMSWAPFLSACVLYDPPSDHLLEFADHDDHAAAALRLRTFSQDGEAREEAGVHRAAFFSGDLTAAVRYGEVLRSSYYESEARPMPGSKGNPANLANPLRDVQCAVLSIGGMHPDQIGERLGIPEQTYIDDYGVTRTRPNAVKKAIDRGKAILDARGACAPKMTDI
jgi:hypothetical protein